MKSRCPTCGIPLGLARLGYRHRHDCDVLFLIRAGWPETTAALLVFAIDELRFAEDITRHPHPIEMNVEPWASRLSCSLSCSTSIRAADLRISRW